jgi:hypothetical protein
MVPAQFLLLDTFAVSGVLLKGSFGFPNLDKLVKSLLLSPRRKDRKGN